MEEYNGYTNKPTWLVSLWIDNDQNDLEAVLEVAKDCIEYEDEPVYQLAQWLEERHDEWQHETIKGFHVFNDLCSFAMAFVNWRELSEMYIQQAKELIEDEQ